MGIEGVLKKGFITTSADTVLNYMRTGSLWPVTFGLACCAVEMMHAGMARYDLDRFGIIFRPSPCLLYTSPSPRDPKTSRMPSSA